MDRTGEAIERVAGKLHLKSSRRHIFLCVGGTCAPKERQMECMGLPEGAAWRN